MVESLVSGVVPASSATAGSRPATRLPDASTTVELAAALVDLDAIDANTRWFVGRAAGAMGVRVGDPVTVFGGGRDGAPTVADWATWAGTIPHEILTGIGARVPRQYRRAAS